MDSPLLTFPFDFGSRVRDLQASGDAARVVAELGDNYPEYHATLAARLAGMPRRPEPSAYHEDFAGFQAANQAVNDVLEAERILRLCLLKRRGDAETDQVFRVPLVDDRERLYDFTDGPPQPGPPRPSVPVTPEQPPTGMAAPPRPTIR